MNYKALILGALMASPLQAETVYKEMDISGVKALVGYSFSDRRSVIDVMVLNGEKRIASVEFVDCFNDGKVDYVYYSHGGPNGSIRRSKLNEKERNDLDKQYEELKNKLK